MISIPGILALTLILVAAWQSQLIRRVRSPNDYPRRRTGKVPPTFPYRLPLLGSLPIYYLWNPMRFVLDPGQVY